MPGTSASVINGGKAKACGKRVKSRNAGTGFTPAPVSGWIIAEKPAGGRPVISERGFVATRTGLDGLRAQLHAEALRRGLGQAAGALVIADGAVWIWRLADDRFKDARQRLDFYHAVQRS